MLNHSQAQCKTSKANRTSEVTIDISQSLVNQELPEENKNPDLVSQLEDESQKDFSKKSSKDNDSIINNNI